MPYDNRDYNIHALHVLLSVLHVNLMQKTINARQVSNFIAFPQLTNSIIYEHSCKKKQLKVKWQTKKLTDSRAAKFTKFGKRLHEF